MPFYSFGPLPLSCVKDNHWWLKYLQSILSSNLGEIPQVSWCVSIWFRKKSLFWSFTILSQVLFLLPLILVVWKISQHSFLVKTDAEKILIHWPSGNITYHLSSLSSRKQTSSFLHFPLTMNVLTESFLLFFTYLASCIRSYNVSLMHLYYFLIFTFLILWLLFSIDYFFMIKSLRNSLFSQLGASLSFPCLLCFRIAFAFSLNISSFSNFQLLQNPFSPYISPSDILSLLKLQFYFIYSILFFFFSKILYWTNPFSFGSGP